MSVTCTDTLGAATEFGYRLFDTSRTSATPSRSCTPAEWISTGPHQPEGVGDEMALAPLDPLSSIEPHLSPRLRGCLDALAVDDPGGRTLLATFTLEGDAFASPPIRRIRVLCRRDYC